jgi:hypothetical protein
VPQPPLICQFTVRCSRLPNFCRRTVRRSWIRRRLSWSAASARTASRPGRARIVHVEAILVAWHDRHIARHLRQLAEARDAAAPAGRLEAVLEAFALIQHQHQDTALPVALLHRGEHVARARRQLQDLVSELLADSAEAGSVRSDIAPDELAGYCLHALTAAGSLPSATAVRRLLAVTMAGLRPPPAG